MKKVFKVLLIIILLLICLCVLATVVKFIKLNNIYKKIDNYAKYNSFHLVTTIEDVSSNNTTVTEELYRNGVSKQIASNGIYTWTDGTKSYLVDEANFTIYTLTKGDSFAIVTSDAYAAPVQGYKKSFFEKILLAASINTSIKKEKIDNVDYYCIKTKEENFTKRVWLEKSTTKIFKSEVELPNGNIVKYNYELIFNTLHSSDVGLPDITGYTLINGETGTVLTDNFISK